MLRLIDEVMTPDSSRFWPAAEYRPGRTQPSFDKQPLRDYLAQLRTAGHWNGEPAPAAAATGRGRGHQRPIPRGVPAAHRPASAGECLMRVAPEGWPFIVIGLDRPGVLAWLHSGSPRSLWAADRDLGGGLLPRSDARGPRGDEIVLAPADGKVVSVIPIDEPLYLRGPATRIAIFMNVFNVHVNRYPNRGRVGLRAYAQGQVRARRTGKGLDRQRASSIGLDTPNGRLLIRQIAGSVARRIVTDHAEGTDVAQAERMGLIRFGSRVDVFVPAGTTVLVKEGDKTMAAQTVVARWK